ncbi:MAG: MBL fold metallo-hydrolase [Actinophytocola sp.]|uniref:MBL fold metallo-hydrolase n=1 Tax=Actinophytocola sp. TaxID=1872138 RepID=UPI001327C912|nr:MBL fold metallo-hydrolase [Actinophytocola sp.]MPZ79917.1 MBL fold metallo-hydrolase [Actinophytocola sp.]
MQIVHFGHSCVLLDTGSARLLFDPGVFSAGFEGVRDLDAILITHQHFDHLDEARLPALVEANPTAALIVDSGSIEVTTKLGLAAEQVRPGDNLTLAGAEVAVVGGEHAVIHADIPVPPNAGYVVGGGAFYHPGDALFVPEQKIDVLGLPSAAPWLKTGEAVDFLRAVAPRVAVPIHQELLSDIGKKLTYDNWFRGLAPEGTEVRVLTPREPTEV